MLTVSTPAPSTPSAVHPGVYTPRERFIRLPEVLYTTGLSRSTVYEMMGRRMMQLTFGRQHFTLDERDALFVAEAILLQRKEPGVVLPEHRSEKHGVIRLASRQAEPRLFRAGPVPLTCAAADTRNDQLTDC